MCLSLNIVENHDGLEDDCVYYRLCYTEDDTGWYGGIASPPMDCSFSQVLAEYPGIAEKNPFQQEELGDIVGENDGEDHDLHGQ